MIGLAQEATAIALRGGRIQPAHVNKYNCVRKDVCINTRTRYATAQRSVGRCVTSRRFLNGASENLCGPPPPPSTPPTPLFRMICPNVILIKNGGVKGLGLPEKRVQIASQWQIPSLG